MTTPADIREQIAAEQVEIAECSRLARKMMSTRNPRGRALKGRINSAQRRIVRLEERLARAVEIERETGASPEEALERATYEDAHGLIRPREFCPECGLRGQHAFTCPAVQA